MDGGREQCDAARLVRGGKGHGHEVQQSGDAKHDLYIGHCEQRRGHGERERRKCRTHGGAPARREEQCRSEVRRRR